MAAINKQIIKEAFFDLQIYPTNDLRIITNAFRVIASKYHPDKSSDANENIYFEAKFKTLVNSRDIALDAASNILNLRSYLDKDTDHVYESNHTYSDKKSEWNAYTENKDEYLNNLKKHMSDFTSKVTKTSKYVGKEILFFILEVSIYLFGAAAMLSIMFMPLLAFILAPLALILLVVKIRLDMKYKRKWSMADN